MFLEFYIFLWVKITLRDKNINLLILRCLNIFALEKISNRNLIANIVQINLKEKAISHLLEILIFSNLYSIIQLGSEYDMCLVLSANFDSWHQIKKALKADPHSSLCECGEQKCWDWPVYLLVSLERRLVSKNNSVMLNNKFYFIWYFDVVI